MGQVLMARGLLPWQDPRLTYDPILTQRMCVATALSRAGLQGLLVINKQEQQ